MWIEDLTMPQMYYGGYETGYQWMNRDIHPPNFKHPSVPGGYIPGGPHISARTNKYDPMYRSIANRGSNLMNEWYRGFINGINDYVRENNLDFPQVPQRGF